MIIAVALIAGAIGGGLMVYVNNTIRQTTELSQTAELKKPDNKNITQDSETNNPQTNTVNENGNNQGAVPVANGTNTQQTEEAALKSAILVDFSCGTKDAKTGWDICRNKEYNFEFEQPHDFNWVKSLAVIPDCMQKAFSGTCPRLDSLISTAALNAAGLGTFVVNPGLFDNQADAVINGENYCTNKSCDGAAGSYGCEFYHAVVKGNDCYIIYSNFFRVNCATYGLTGSEYDGCNKGQEKDDDTFNKVVSTFKFTD
jgi:hypothetical protein